MGQVSGGFVDPGIDFKEVISMADGAQPVDTMMTNGQDQLGQNEASSQEVFKNITGEIDSQRGRGAYSSAEKAFKQLNDATDVSVRQNGALAQQFEANVAFGEQDKQQTLRHNDAMFHQAFEHNNEEFHQALRHVDDLHVVMVQTLMNGVVDNQLSMAQALQTMTAQIQALQDKMVALTPPVSVK